MIVIFEGLDNCGKTTIITLLEKYYIENGINIEISKEFKTPIGELLKELIVAKKADPILKTFLFAADRYYRMKDKTFNEDTLYLFDRYVPSAVAYRDAEGCDIDWVKGVNSIFPEPDLCFYIDISPEESILRNTDSKFNIKYDKEFLSNAKKCYDHNLTGDNCIRIDGSKSIEEILNIVINSINNIIECNQKDKIKERGDNFGI